MTDDQFYSLLYKYINRSISKEQLELLYREIDKKLEHKIIFNHLTKSQIKKENTEILEDRFQKILNNINGQENIPYPIYKTNALKKYFTYIAAASLIIIGYFSIQVLSPEPNPIKKYHFTTKYGERREFVLPDGSKVWLNAGSRIEYYLDHSQNKRIVSLDGEGFFDVAHNKHLPMIITAKELEVKVLGTSFNIRAYKNEHLSEASLLTGKIELQIKSKHKIIQQTLLKPGEKLKVVSNHQHIHSSKSQSQDDFVDSGNTINISKTQLTLLENNNSPQETAWKNNVLVMEGESLKEALSKLERWFASTVLIQNQALDTIKITGSFQEKSIEELIQILKISGLPIKHKKDMKNQIILY